MAIERKHKGGGANSGRIDKIGDYIVTVEEAKTGLSSKKDKMLTITFVTDDEKRIRGYYVGKHKFMMDALADLKASCGLKATDHHDGLIGKKLGIAVGAQDPTEDGKVFMQIEGYGKVTEVNAGTTAAPSDFGDDLGISF